MNVVAYGEPSRRCHADQCRWLKLEYKVRVPMPSPLTPAPALARQPRAHTRQDFNVAA